MVRPVNDCIHSSIVDRGLHFDLGRQNLHDNTATRKLLRLPVISNAVSVALNEAVLSGRPSQVTLSALTSKRRNRQDQLDEYSNVPMVRRNLSLTFFPDSTMAEDGNRSGVGWRLSDNEIQTIIGVDIAPSLLVSKQEVSLPEVIAKDDAVKVNVHVNKSDYPSSFLHEDETTPITSYKSDVLQPKAGKMALILAPLSLMLLYVHFIKRLPKYLTNYYS